MTEQAQKETVLLEQLKQSLSEKNEQERSLWKELTSFEFGNPIRQEITEKRNVLMQEVEELKKQILQQSNIAHCLQNNGELTNITDKIGKSHGWIPDFRKVDTNYITFDEENILIEPQPKYIPYLDETSLKYKGYVFDAIRIEKDTYILSIRSFSTEQKNDFVLLTLDQLVLTLDYYYIKAKATNQKEAERKEKLQEDYWDKQPEEKRERFLNQPHLYNSLPAKIKKTITQQSYEALSWQEKEKIYKFYKRIGAERLKSKLGEKQMWVSFHAMYQIFIDPTAYPVNSLGQPQPNAEVGKMRSLYGNPIIFKYWYAFREMMDFKIKDIKIQRDDIAETYATAIETSFGESNTNTSLKDKYGVLVKRQNGDPINPTEISQIEDAWSMVQKTFGNLKPNAEKYNIKVSHSGQRLIFASKAIGVYIPSMGTIGVSNKYGDHQFKSTMSHEVGHFIDNFIGELNGKRWATDDYESTAGQIAIEFRNNMNKPKSQQTDYVNATKECFARAFQQYFGEINYGENATISHSYVDLGRTEPIYNSENFVSRSTFDSTVKPLIVRFLSENEDVFKFTVDIDNSNEIVPVGTEESLQETKEISNLTKKDIDHVIFGESKDSNESLIKSAILYLARNEGSVSEVSFKENIKPKEEPFLERFINENGLLINFDFSEKRFVNEGSEQKVYRLDDKHVVKANDAIFYNSWRDYLKSLLLHNFFFPDTKYKLIGFAKNNNVLYAIIDQVFVGDAHTSEKALVQKEMSDNGFLNTKNNDYYNPDLGLILEDLHDENVLTKDRVLYFIDTVFYITKPELKDKKHNNYGNTGNNAHQEAEISDGGTQVENRESAVEYSGIEKARLYIRRCCEATKKEQSVIDNETQINCAFKYSKENNLWIDDFSKLGRPLSGGGNENTLYLDEKNGIIYKSNNLFNYKFSITVFLDAIEAYNDVFVSNKYELVGFTGIENKNSISYLEPVIKQDYIFNSEKATQNEIDDHMFSLGFSKINDHTFSNDKYIVSDLRPRNVLKDSKGEINVIDAIVKTNTDNADILATIDGLELLLDDATDQEKQDIQDTIDGLRLILE